MKKRLIALLCALTMLLTAGCSILKKPEADKNDLAQKLAQAMTQQAQEEKDPEAQQPEEVPGENADPAPEIPDDPMLWTTETAHLAQCRMPETAYGENEGDLSIAWNYDGMALMKMSRMRVNDALEEEFERAKAMQDARFTKEAENWPGFAYCRLESETEKFGTACRNTQISLMNEDWLFRFEAEVETEGGEEYLELVDRMAEQLFVEDLDTVLALAQSAYEGGGYEAGNSGAFSEYAALLNDFWVAENYADEGLPYVWYFTEEGTVFLSYEEYYTDLDGDAATVEWGLTDDEALTEAYYSQCDPYDAYEPESGSGDVLYIINPRGTADPYVLPMQLEYSENKLTVYWGYDEVQTFYRVGTKRASRLLDGTYLDGELPMLHYAYLRIDEKRGDGFVAAMEDVLFLGWEDEDLMIQYGIDPNEVDNDYAIVEINEGAESLLPVYEGTALSVIDWDGELGGDPDAFVFGLAVDSDIFCEHVMKRYNEYGTRTFVTYVLQGGVITKIEEMYLP